MEQKNRNTKVRKKTLKTLGLDQLERLNRGYAEKLLSQMLQEQTEKYEKKKAAQAVDFRSHIFLCDECKENYTGLSDGHALGLCNDCFDTCLDCKTCGECFDNDFNYPEDDCPDCQEKLLT